MKTIIEIAGGYAAVLGLAYTFPKTMCVVLGALFVAAFVAVYVYLETHTRH